MNVVMLRGIVKKIFDVRSSGKGSDYVNFTIETHKSFESKSGEKKHITSQITICKFGFLSLDVGDDVLITGELWSRKDGDRYIISVVAKQIDKINKSTSDEDKDLFISSDPKTDSSIPF